MNPTEDRTPQELHLSTADQVIMGLALEDYAGTLEFQAEDMTEGPHRRWLRSQAAQARDLVELLDSHTFTMTPRSTSKETSK